MPVITIRGQLGSGAPQIGQACAEALNYEFIDRDIVNLTAERLQLPRQEIITKEVLPTTFRERMARLIEEDFTKAGFSSLTGPGKDNNALDDKHYLKGLKSVVRGLARRESVVIYGRGSQFLLKKHEGAFHILVIAPLETRVKRIMEDSNLDEETARKKVLHADDERKEFVKKYFKADLEDPVNYDLTINTGKVGYEEAVMLILQALHLKDRE